jgi:hypothetical protein
MMGFLIALGILLALVLAFCVIFAVRRGRDTSGSDLDVEMMYDIEREVPEDAADWAFDDLESDSAAWSFSAPDSMSGTKWSNNSEEGKVARNE